MEVSVISFNIRNNSDANGNSREERAPRLSAVTSKYDADLIGFQEYIPGWEELIEKYYGEEYDMFNKYRSQGADRESAPLLWKKDKFECIKTGYFWLSDTPEVESKGWDEKYDCYRICAYVILKSKETGEVFTFMNTHYGFGDKCQVDSSKLIYEYSKKISDYPTFVVGDFNMTPKSAGYGEMTKYFTDVNAVTANDLRTTFHGYNPEKWTNSHIDYCFVDEKITPVHQEIIDELVDNKFPSDHYGIYMKIKF